MKISFSHIGQLCLEVVKSVRSSGLKNTFRLIISTLQDVSFDWIHGTDTYSGSRLSNIIPEHPNAARSSLYEPTRARPLLALFNLLHLDKRRTFVDYGSGKGRALIVAALYGFTKIIGIEFAKELCEISETNIQTMRSKFPDADGLDRSG